MEAESLRRIREGSIGTPQWESLVSSGHGGLGTAQLGECELTREVSIRVRVPHTGRVQSRIAGPPLPLTAQGCLDTLSRLIRESSSQSS